MNNNDHSLKDVIGSTVSTTKPQFTDIDQDKLQAFLSSAQGFGEPVTISKVRGGGSSAGASSGIVIFTADSGNKSADYVLRYAPMNNEGRIFVEYGIDKQCELQSRLSQTDLPVTPGLCIDASGEHIGLPGFVMPFVKGKVADSSPYTGGIIAEASAQDREDMLDKIVEMQGRIHAVDWQKLELEKYVKAAEGRTPLERYLNWFWKTAQWVQPEELQRLEKLKAWLIANQPDYHVDDYRLMHGDPGLGNYMFDGLNLVSILDWELAGIVHPTFDIALTCMFNNFFRAAAPAEVASLIPTNEDWIARYETQTGSTVKDFDYFQKYVIFGVLIVNTSMNRNVPGDMKDKHAAMNEPLWAIAESA